MPRARSRRRRWPPDSVPTRWSSWGASPTSSTTSGRRRSRSRSRTPSRPPATVSSCSTPEVCSTMPMRSRKSRVGPARIGAQHADVTRRARAVALEDLDGRRLAGPVLTEQGVDLALADLERDPVDRPERPVLLAQIPNLTTPMRARRYRRRCGQGTVTAWSRAVTSPEDERSRQLAEPLVVRVVLVPPHQLPGLADVGVLTSRGARSSSSPPLAASSSGARPQHAGADQGQLHPGRQTRRRPAPGWRRRVPGGAPGRGPARARRPAYSDPLRSLMCSQ